MILEKLEFWSSQASLTNSDVWQSLLSEVLQWVFFSLAAPFTVFLYYQPLYHPRSWQSQFLELSGQEQNTIHWECPLRDTQS